MAPSRPLEGLSIAFVGTGLAEHEEAIRQLMAQAYIPANEALAIGAVNISVSSSAERTVPGWGMAGYTLSDSEIEIVVEPGYPGLAQALTQRLPQTLAHELHHVVRWRGPGPYDTLLEALVFEGLADHFALELLGGLPPPWLDAFSEDQTDTYLERARPELDAFFDFNAWFFGLGTDLPRWTGYTLGYRLVSEYLERHPGTSAAQLVNTPAEAFRP